MIRRRVGNGVRDDAKKEESLPNASAQESKGKKSWLSHSLVKCMIYLLAAVGGASFPFAVTHYRDGMIALSASTAAATATADAVTSKVTSKITLIKPKSNPAVPMLNENKDIIANLKPIFGQHRSEANAVFALAAGYGLNVYLQLIGSLRATGYSGDIVLATDTFDKMPPELKHYLTQQQHLILYNLRADCFKQHGGSNCQVQNLFYNTTSHQISHDVRIHRPFATLRFDVYWYWSTQYLPHSKILLADSRDVVFQADPFRNIPSHVHSKGGALHFYEEKMPIHTSAFNMRWLKAAGYTNAQIDAFKHKPILCSGVTIGEQIAMESYLRTLLLEFDATQCVAHGCDQGLHNYIYYSGKLQQENPATIANVTTYTHGTGHVINLAGLRHENKPLRELGVLIEEATVVNVDGSLPNIAHQVDRDAELAKYFRIKYNQEARKVEAEYRALLQSGK